MDQENHEVLIKQEVMNTNANKEWLNLPENTRRNIFRETATNRGLPAAVVEKDWWVVRTLEMIFDSEISDHTVFKGGTSLSKAWQIIDRFSEDIDLALDRNFLGFDGAISKEKVKKLRKESFRYISAVFFPWLKNKFRESGFTDVNIKLGEAKYSDQDPLLIEVYYPELTDPIPYVPSRVLVELGSRSLREPFTKKNIVSFVGENYSDRSWADQPILIPTVNPERTLWEKVLLLHEEFAKTEDKVRIERMSRHLYDIEKFMNTCFAEKALNDQELFDQIVAHRKLFNPVRGIDYALHRRGTIGFLPPERLKKEWEKDYNEMMENMVYGEKLTFDKLMERLNVFMQKINH